MQTRKLKTLLAYSSTSHIGYTLLAFGSIFPHLAFETIFFYLIIYIIAGLCTWFIILSLTLKTKTITNKYNKELGDITLLHKSNSALAIAFALTLFSIAGIPPMIGFLAKMNVFLSIIRSGLHLDIFNPWEGEIYSIDLYEFFFIALITILCSVISTFYYIRVVKIMYFENTLVGKLYYPINNQKIVILSFLVFLLLFLLVNPTFLYLILEYASSHFYTFSFHHHKFL